MQNLKKNNNIFVNNYNHLFALTLLLAYYFLSLIIFKQVVINPHDNLDHLVVYDHIIGKIINGDLSAANYFLSGQIKWFYIENIFYPINLLHLILDNKQYYFVVEILKKLLAYFTFYILAKSIYRNKAYNSISALLFSSVVNLDNLFGFGIVMMPYFFYLLINKKKLKFKHIFIIFFTGLNSTLVQDYLALLLLIPASFLIKQSVNNLKVPTIYFANISISMLISCLPIIFSLIDIKEIHRTDIEIDSFYFIFTDFFNTFSIFFSNKVLEEPFIFTLLILNFLIIFLSVASRNKKILIFTFFLATVFIFSLFINTFLKSILFHNYLTFFKGYNFERIDRIIPLMISILIVYNLNLIKNSFVIKIICFLSIFSVVLIQSSFITREAGKQFLQNNLKENKYLDFRNFFFNNTSLLRLSKFLTEKKNYKNDNLLFDLKSEKTFNNYYRFEAYKHIKSITGQERTISIGLNPMIAVMNDIKVIDGYHTIYPKSYKKKFRKIIANELEKNEILKQYYDSWGNRVYAFYTNSNELLIDFNEAKKVGANFVISSFAIENVNLKLICKDCHSYKNIFLYRIL